MKSLAGHVPKIVLIGALGGGGFEFVFFLLNYVLTRMGGGNPFCAPNLTIGGGGYVPPCAPRHSVPVGPHLSRGGFSKSSFSFKNTN